MAAWLYGFKTAARLYHVAVFELLPQKAKDWHMEQGRSTASGAFALYAHHERFGGSGQGLQQPPARRHRGPPLRERGREASHGCRGGRARAGGRVGIRGGEVPSLDWRLKSKMEFSGYHQLLQRCRQHVILGRARANSVDFAKLAAAAGPGWPTTPPHKWTLCWETTAPERRRTRRRPAPSRPRCWPTTPPHKWTRCWDYRTASAQDRADAGGHRGLLAYRTGPDQDVFTTNQITSALVAYRSAADQDTATALSYAMTLSAFAWNIVRTHTLTLGRRYSFGCRHRLGTASNLVMYVSAADNDYVGVTGTFLGTALQGVWSTARLDFSVPLGGIAKLHFGAFGGSIPGLVQQSAGTLDLCSMQIRASAFEGESVSVTDLLADSLALTGSATLDGLTAQGNVGSSLSITGAASVGLLSSATGITGSTLTINNTANAGNFTTVGDVSTGTLTASGAATAASFAATGALTGATLTVSGAPRARWTARAWAAPSRPRAAECRRAAWCAAT